MATSHNGEGPFITSTLTPLDGKETRAASIGHTTPAESIPANPQAASARTTDAGEDECRIDSEADEEAVADEEEPLSAEEQQYFQQMDALEWRGRVAIIAVLLMLCILGVVAGSRLFYNAPPAGTPAANVAR